MQQSDRLQRLARRIGKHTRSPELRVPGLAFALAEYLKIDPGEVALIDLGIDFGVDPEQLRAANPVFPAALGMQFAYIPAGTFLMGSSLSEMNRTADEVQHKVILSEPYWMGIFPVTVGEFEQFVQATHYQTEDQDRWRTPGFEQTGRHPVTCVSWNDAQAMVMWLNETSGASGLLYALPTEAQWEYACRAGTQSAYWFGNDAGELSAYAWFGGNANKQPQPVETKGPNPWGLYHMHGNIWEWCQDWYAGYSKNARKSGGGSSRVCRGGSWSSTPESCRSAHRFFNDPDRWNNNLGFRLAVCSAGEDLAPIVGNAEEK